MSHQAMSASQIPSDVHHWRGKKAARTRAARRAASIDPNTTDPHLAVRFELHTRGKTISDLAVMLNVSEKYLHERFGGTARCRAFSPALLDKVITALKIPNRRAQELHAIAARQAGWKV